ncbi:hypothetical protein [Lacrimispora sp. 210928-DFI.3.58]|uniref:hypothetical protein n=1 Tax=Lacrimispora sp. 210928-DFI.3.58 TaxID=2883214 RepID=UPI001D069091|nr:hypothetical protein [Lacrimispora sp. 210928-DFI.3.58]MCB7320774.1 hypothetical protein [Lacrimispora sp. 210928-DFI.3.58]
MAADSVGQIGLDLVVNKGSFDKQMAGIQSTAKKAGMALAAAFTVKKLVNFGAQCIELGSDLAEVQNVVDVTFPRMSKQVDAFAKNAITQFGLSETMAKKFTGTFGAMAQAFGFGEKAAYDMSTTLTGLAGDVASFYNISQDEAYTKLKSVFTGETESLKDLGVVMTQTALDSYALANGFGKTTAKMSEMEKVALRYKFVQDQLSTSAGDFSRTADGWANQVRVLKLQFDSLKATIGQGLINVLTPVIQVINTIIGKLMSLANAFKAFTELITGKKGSGGAGAAAAGMEAVAQSADKAGAAAGGAGSAAKKAAKDMKSVTTGIDELNIINPDTSDSGSGSGGGAGGYEVDQFDMGELDSSAADEMGSKYQGLIDKAKELSSLFKAGFWDGFGDTSVFDSIQNSIDSIKTSLRDIFTAPEVVAAANSFADAVAYSLGQIAGSVASIGATIADNLLGGVALFLEQNTGRIQEYLVAMFDIGGSIATISGNFSSAVAKIFSVFRSDSAKQITADIIGIFSEVFMGVTELLGKLGRDILNALTKPIIDNKDAIKNAIQGILDTIQPIIGKIKELLGKMFDGLNKAYDLYAKPVFDALAQALSDVVAWCLENTGTIEAITAVVAAFFAAWEVVKLGEFIINAGGVAGIFQSMAASIAAATAALLANAKALIANTAAKIADKAETAAIVALYAKDFVVSVASTVSALAKQAAQFAINTAAKLADAVAQGTMTAATVAWNAVCTIATALTTAFGAAIAFLTSPIGLVVVAITGLIAAGVLLYQHWDEVKAKALEVWENIKNIISDTWITVQTKTTLVWNAVKSFVNSQWNNIKSLASSIFEAIKTAITTAWENVKTTTSEVWESIKSFLSTLWDTVKITAETTFTNLKDSVVGVWNTLKEETKRIWDGIWADIKGIINMIINGVESMANRVIDAINAMIEAVNEVADKVPGIGAELIPKIPNIHLPRLAQGGFVRANTPQLAMIGDNRHYGEIVAPEDKMQEMVDRAVALATQNSSGGMSEYYLASMVELLKNIVDLIEQMDMTVTIDIREIKKKLVELDARSGHKLRTT